MFFRRIPRAMIETSGLAKELAVGYLKVSAAGAGFGGAVGGFVCTFFSAPVFCDSVSASNAPTKLGKLTKGVEDVGRLWGHGVGYGMFLGGAPVTYPVAKTIEHFRAGPKR